MRTSTDNLLGLVCAVAALYVAALVHREFTRLRALDPCLREGARCVALCATRSYPLMVPEPTRSEQECRQNDTLATIYAQLDAMAEWLTERIELLTADCIADAGSREWPNCCVAGSPVYIKTRRDGCALRLELAAAGCPSRPMPFVQPRCPFAMLWD